MRILFLTPQLPYPPHSGGPLRNFGLLDGLKRAGYCLDLLTFTEPSHPDPQTTPLASLCDEIVAIPTPHRTGKERLRDLFFSRTADIARRFESSYYRAALLDMLRRQHYDAVQIEGLELACYLPEIREHAPHAKVTYDAHNAEHNLQRLIAQVDRRDLSRLPAAIYSTIQARRLTVFERSICKQSDRVISVSDADADALRALVPGLQVTVIPNGIYVDDYAHPPNSIDLGPASLLFTGTMNYRPNVDAMIWFAESIFGEISGAVPDARLFIVGNKPHGRLERIRRKVGIEITGYVQDVTPFLYAATVYVAPLRMGSGTRLKILQAMAAGSAIVSTRIGAAGLNVTSGHEIMLADDATSFAQAAVALLRNPPLREKLGKAAQALVRSQYDWSVITPQLVQIYKALEA